MIEQMMEILRSNAQEHVIGIVLLFILIRALAIVGGPWVLGAPIDLAGIAMWGWIQAFVLAEIGIMLGAMICFWIARSQRHRVSASRFFQKVQEKVGDLSDRRSFWAFVGLRLISNPLFDPLSYAAGLTSCRATTFFFATLLGNIPSVFIFFYVGGKVVKYQSLVAVLVVAAIGLSWWLYQRRR